MSKKLPTYWAPQVGRQTIAAICPCDEVFYGGTRGGGKSDCAIGRQIRGAIKYGDRWNGLMIRRKYKDLLEIRRRFDGLIKRGMPAERIGGEKDTNYVKFRNGGSITLAAIQRLEQADDFWGMQFTEITIDEAPGFPFIPLLIDKLKGSLRSPYGVPCHMFMTGNPGGPGASAIKMMYIDPDPQGSGKVIIEEHDNPITGEVLETTKCFIRSTIYDNKILVENDPRYVNKLLSIRDPQLRAAWIEGRWDVFIGQAFEFDANRHILQHPIWPIPDYAPIYMTFDWGFGAPFSVGWWWVDSDNRVYRFAEWYGWNGETPNIGCRMIDRDIARGILEREQKMKISGRDIKRLAGKDCFNKKPDYMGGGQGPSTFNEWRDYADSAEAKELFGENVKLDILPGDPSRALKIRQFQTRMALPKDPKQMPMLMVYPECKHFIRTIPSLVLDEANLEDLEDNQEDHIYDEACHVAMARPIGTDLGSLAKQLAKDRKRKEVQKLPSEAREAAREFHQINRRLADQSGVDYGDDSLIDPEIYGMQDRDTWDDLHGDIPDDIPEVLQNLGLLGA